jgi:hypothetical protein
MFQKCIMCGGLDLHWFCNKCEKKYSIHHPAVMAKMERYRLKLKLDKEFNRA